MRSERLSERRDWEWGKGQWLIGMQRSATLQKRTNKQCLESRRWLCDNSTSLHGRNKWI